MLDLAGSLDRSRPGCHPFPAVSTWHFTAHKQFKADYPSNHRSVYLMVQRMQPHPYLAIFNGPDTSMSTPVRDNASVPLQALFLLNSSLVHQQAAQFARSLIEQRSDPVERLRLAYLRAYGRPPPAEEEPIDRSDYLRRYEQPSPRKASRSISGRPNRGRAWPGRCWHPTNSSMWNDQSVDPACRTAGPIVNVAPVGCLLA